MFLIPSAYLMCRPANFGFNPETFSSNSFQQVSNESTHTISSLAMAEFDAMVSLLLQHEVSLVLVNDTPHPFKPDAVFPNNWFSTHSDGHLIIYPMAAQNRRTEVRFDVLEAISDKYTLLKRIDLQHKANENKFLEGTGSLVFDHENKKCFASVSSRTNSNLVEEVCRLLGYKSVIFSSYNAAGKLIYHTNMVLSIGNKFAVVCDDVIVERDYVLNELLDSKLEIIKITVEEMLSFGANMLQLHNRKEQQLIMLSEAALKVFRPEILTWLNNYGKLLPVSIPTIEKVGGGSARCMVAEIFKGKSTT